MQYYDKFQDIHELFTAYNCKPTYSFYEEYSEESEIDYFFYETFKKVVETDKIENEWHEGIIATLDVTIKTKIAKAILSEIRFRISYSAKVKKYDMAISLPTHSRSIFLSKDNYKTQDEMILEINKWLQYAKCKKLREKKKATEVQNIQLSLF